MDALTALDESQCLSTLFISHCEDVRRVPTRISDILFIESCEELEHVVVGEDAKDDSLQSLNDNLRKIEIWKCDRLKVVFNKGMARRLDNLEEINVWDCCGVEEVIDDDEEAEDDGSSLLLTLPKLRRLRLRDLPQLCSICSKHILHCPLIQNVEVVECPQLKEPLRVCNALGLLFITGEDWDGEVVEGEQSFE
ncbi:hypothetical protein AMTR_s00096p00056370 [Amborella trichopoda]|uniref:Disease resistance protein At4g27190-like leucine-rich repeats domain-containing protein n=1 Tax=Amborella trichopoda TaxID=13333 RepID=W1P367_AMBTC|nr:hypothetical protein AMTR_s00096p00056370 [Amborella trichopoda]